MLLHRTCDDHGVAGVVGDSPGFCQNFEDGDGVVRLIYHRVCNRPHYGDGLAFSFLYADANLRVRNQSISFQDFRDLLFGLDFG